VDGIVTLEDLVEEVVGEIYDETDRDVQAVKRDSDGTLLLPGTFPVHDLPDIGVDLDTRPDGDYTTVAGPVITLLGHLPKQPGETVPIDGWTAQITTVDRHAITSVRLHPTSAGAATPADQVPQARDG
jgi:putative hemolysin